MLIVEIEVLITQWALTNSYIKNELKYCKNTDKKKEFRKYSFHLVYL